MNRSIQTGQSLLTSIISPHLVLVNIFSNDLNKDRILLTIYKAPAVCSKHLTSINSINCHSILRVRYS